MLHSSFFFLSWVFKGRVPGTGGMWEALRSRSQPLSSWKLRLVLLKILHISLTGILESPPPINQMGTRPRPPTPTPNNTYSETFAQMYNVHSSKDRARCLCQFGFLFFFIWKLQADISDVTPFVISGGRYVFQKSKGPESAYTLAWDNAFPVHSILIDLRARIAAAHDQLLW